MVLSADPGLPDPESRILDAAEALFYARGVHPVGMDAVRAEAEVSLKRLYQLFPSKDRLVEAVLRRRDTRWLAALSSAARAADGGPRERVLAAFDWLGAWCAQPGFRGCAFTNAFGELGASSPAVAALAGAHKGAFRALFLELVEPSRDPEQAGTPGERRLLADQLYLLAEGAITACAITGDPGLAVTAKLAAGTLVADSLIEDNLIEDTAGSVRLAAGRIRRWRPDWSRRRRGPQP